MSNTGVLTTINGNSYNQFGKQVLCTQVRFSTLEAIFDIDHEVQRQLDPRKRAEIREFILISLEKGEPIYFSPFIFSGRNSIQKSDEGFTISPGSKIVVLDGQHRCSALASAISQLKLQKEAAEEAGEYRDALKVGESIIELSSYPITMQVYLGLNQQEERQLFTDINTERRDAHAGILLQYDQRDQYIELTRTVANLIKDKVEIEFELSRLTDHNSSITSLITMRKCMLALFEGLLSTKKGDPYFKNCKVTEVPMIAKAFFESWPTIFPKQMADRKKYVTGLTGIQIALAQTVYTLTRESPITHMEAIRLLKLLKKRCTWRHDDPAFNHMYNPNVKLIKNHSTTTAIKKTVLNFMVLINEERTVLHDHRPGF